MNHKIFNNDAMQDNTDDEDEIYTDMANKNDRVA